MNLFQLFDYNILKNNYQESSYFWIDNHNNIHELTHEDSHYSYLKESLKNKDIDHSWPYKNGWIKIGNYKFSLEISGFGNRILETQHIWKDIVLQRCLSGDQFPLYISVVDESTVSKNFRINMPERLLGILDF